MSVWCLNICWLLWAKIMLTNCILLQLINCALFMEHMGERKMEMCHMLNIELTLNLKINISIYTMIETCLTTVVRESDKTNWSRIEQRRRFVAWFIQFLQLIGIGIEIELSHDKLTILIQIACRMQIHLSFNFDQKFNFIGSLSFIFISPFVFNRCMWITTFAPTFNL